MVQVGALTCPLNWISTEEPVVSAIAVFIKGNNVRKFCLGLILKRKAGNAHGK